MLKTISSSVRKWGSLLKRPIYLIPNRWVYGTGSDAVILHLSTGISVR